MQLRPLTAACGEPGTDTAQRFLTSAFESVDAVLETLETLRDLRRQQAGGQIRGRLTSNEEDLLRAAIVFTGAGLDATLKGLSRLGEYEPCGVGFLEGDQAGGELE